MLCTNFVEEPSQCKQAAPGALVSMHMDCCTPKSYPSTASDECEADLVTFVQIYDQLDKLYDDPPCPLNHENPFQLLCSVILSSQVSLPQIHLNARWSLISTAKFLPCW